MESRNNKKRCMGRVTKNLADLTLQAGLVPEALSLYNSAGEILKSVNDWLWLGAAKEGYISTSSVTFTHHINYVISQIFFCRSLRNFSHNSVSSLT